MPDHPARVLVVDTYAIVASVLRHKSDLTVIQIWHALGAFKKFGISILGQEEGRDERIARAMRMHEGYDHSYWFIQSFVANHIAHHARQLV